MCAGQKLNQRGKVRCLCASGWGGGVIEKEGMGIGEDEIEKGGDGMQLWGGGIS